MARGSFSRADLDRIDMVVVRRVLAGERLELTRAEHNRVYLELIDALDSAPLRPGGWHNGTRGDRRIALAARGLGKTPKDVTSYIGLLRKRIAERGGVVHPFKPRRTVCDHGHQMTPDNVYVQPGTGKRSCRACRRKANTEWKRRKRNFNAEKTHCPAGHAYDDENTLRYKNRRYCRQCRRDRDWAAYEPTGTPQPAVRNRAKTHCNRGHEFDDKNTYVTKDGRRQCRQCRRDRDARRSKA